MQEPRTNVARQLTKKALNDKRIRACILSFVFLLSAAGSSVLVSPASAASNSADSSVSKPLASASPLSQAQANWAYPGGNSFNQAYNPQNLINSSDAKYLGISWLFPIPDRPLALAAYSFVGGESVDTSVLIINGTIYAISQFDQVFALNAANGDIEWTVTIPITLSSINSSRSPLALHAHDGIDAFTTASFGSGVSGPTLWFQAANNYVYALNALNGHGELNFTDFTGPSMVKGNSPTSFYYAVGVSNILIDQAKGIMITSHQAEIISANGRCYYMGWNLNLNPPTPIWTAYCTPPQPLSDVPVDPAWTVSQVNNMSSAEIFYPGSRTSYTTPAEISGGLLKNTNDSIVVQLKSLSSSQLNATLYNDWGYANQSPGCQVITGGSSTGSAGAGWGGAWLLGSGPTKGIAFVNTNNKDPYAGPCTPGPDLWSAALLAINVTTGAWIWGFQANAHDLWDWDCAWWQAGANETINGVNTPVVLKTCKNGYLYELNALTGDLIWAWTPPNSVISRCPECYMLNPLNRTQMDYEFVPQVLGQPPKIGSYFVSNPGIGFEDNQAYNPSLNYIFAVSENLVGLLIYSGLNSSTYFTGQGEAFGAPSPGYNIGGETPLANATIFAVNAGTGATVWQHFIPLQGYRGGVTTSGDLVLATLSTGDLLILNAANGNVARDFYVGGPLNVTPSVGATANGTEEIVFPVDAGLVTWATAVPGDIVALGMQGTPSTGVATTTVTEQGAPGTTVTSTTTVTVSAATATVTSGASSTTLYAVVVLAVVFIIATSYLAVTRNRKLST